MRCKESAERPSLKSASFPEQSPTLNWRISDAVNKEKKVLISETDRMLIRPLSLDDLPALTSILSDPLVMKHSVRGICDEAATRQFIACSVSSYAALGVGPWALTDKRSSELIGFCGVGLEAVKGTDEINLGYRLAKHAWGRGLATEAARAVLDYVFGQKRLSSVVALIEPEHTASLRVAEKLGFSAFENIDFHGRPVRLYRMTLAQWEASHNPAPHATRA